MKFSLILCTVGRTDVVVSFLESLTRQTYKDFECIVLDQNDDDRLEECIQTYKGVLPLQHIRSTKKGLSLNRNIGVEHSSGDIIAFPDDDCEYLPSTLEDVHNFFTTHPEKDLLTINIKDLQKEEYFIDEKDSFPLDRYSYYKYAISIGIFVKTRQKEDVHFDELMGAGQKFGSGEESDMVSNLLEKGYRAYYQGSTFVLHPVEAPTNNLEVRYERYNMGYGALMKKEIVARRKYSFLHSFSFDLIKRFIAGIIPVKKRKLYWISFRSRVKGYLSYPIDK